MTSNKINLKEDKGQIKDEDKSGKRAQKQPPEVFNKKVFLKISQYSQENTYTRVSPRPHSACLWDTAKGVSLRILRNFKNKVFTVHLRATAFKRSFTLL